MEVLAGPALIIVPGALALLWSIFAVRRATAQRRWTPVTGRIVRHERDPPGHLVDVIAYPLPEGGTRELRPLPYGQYTSGRPVGTPVAVWRDPADPLEAVCELPTLERFAGPLLVGILGGFLLGAGLIWAGLILALVAR